MSFQEVEGQGGAQLDLYSASRDLISISTGEKGDGANHTLYLRPEGSQSQDFYMLGSKDHLQFECLCHQVLR